MQVRNFIYLGLAVVALAAGILTAKQLLNSPSVEADSNMTVTAKNDFTLTQNNQAVHLQDFRG